MHHTQEEEQSDQGTHSLGAGSKADQVELSKKIRLLFEHRTDTSQFVGLLLATRLHDNDTLLEVLNGWDVASSSDDDQANWCTWLGNQHSLARRLVAQILHRVVLHVGASTSTTAPRHHCKVIDNMGVALVKNYNMHNDDDVTTTSECLSAVEIWLEAYCRKSKVMDEALYQLQQRAFWREQPSTSSIDDDHAGDDRDIDEDAQSLFRSTLTTLLDATTIVGDTETSATKNMVLLGRIFQRGATRIVKSTGRLPRFFESLLKAWLEKQTDHPTMVANLLLTTAQQCPAKPRSSKNTTLINPPKAEIYHGVVRLVLACIVSPDESTTTFTKDEETPLAVAAWSTLLHWIELYGWDWMMQKPQEDNNQNSASSSLGAAVHVCTFVRLAAGECKIQLEENLVLLSSTASQHQHHGAQYDANKNVKTICNRRLELCVQFLVAVVQQYLAVALDGDSTNTMLPGDAVRHLQRSLEETLVVTAEYLVLASERPAASVFAVRLFAVLLTELDAFTVGHGANNDDGINMEQARMLKAPAHDDSLYEESVVQALRVAVDHAKDSITIGFVLRGLLPVMLAAEDIGSRVELLLEVLGDCMTRFLARAFGDRTATSCSLLRCACEVLELYHHLGAVYEVTTLQRAIEDSLEFLLSKRSTVKEICATLGQLVCTYAVLQGDNPPENEKTALILQRSFQLSQLQE